ncbi:MAG TPA: exonuclease domain-containing protein [Pyrinomonadaceae bacterium]|nr:exonuclease domain-containing protein [Pyrinomonadaceae bacterium]
MTPEMYFSVDIESAGPIPGKYSMLSLGACVVGNSEREFYVELKPITKEFVPEALKVSGFDLDRLEQTGQTPIKAMRAFSDWIEASAKDHKAVFVGFNACYDWQFVNWYLESFTGGNPLGFGGIDIKSYFMGLRGVPWSKTTSSQLPTEFQPDTAQTHNALEDARAQASMFRKLLNAHK